MHSFESDYTAGARVEILRRLNETNLEQLPGYGSDKYCESAKEKIRAACDCPGADIFFMVGGTQTNAVVIDSMLPSYGGVIAAQTGHISDHEAGAIEFTGHKVIALPVYDGKLRAEDVWMYMKDYWQDASHQHFVYPGMVYISYPTEFGTLYTKRELVELASVCRWYNIPLYIDGARLGYGLMSPKCDITLPELAQLCDVFYIGGTKVGALFGEAVVITNDALKPDFRYHIKQRGGMLAKGRLLGLQFEALLADNLYTELGAHANAMGRRLRDLFTENDYPMMSDSLTNQQFAVLPDRLIEALRAADYRFELQMRVDETHCAMRFVTSWATPEAAVEQFADDFLRLARQCGA